MVIKYLNKTCHIARVFILCLLLLIVSTRDGVAGINRLYRYIISFGAYYGGIDVEEYPPIVPPLVDPFCSSGYIAPNYEFHAQGKYWNWGLGLQFPDRGQCNFGNRSAPEYCNYLEPYLQALGYNCAGKYYDRDTDADELRYDSGNLKVWAGHGIRYNSPEGVAQGGESAAHFFSYNSTYHPYDEHGGRDYNLSWGEIRWGKERFLSSSEISDIRCIIIPDPNCQVPGHWVNNTSAVDYAAMYTCNFLNVRTLFPSDLHKIFSMFQGMHLMVGFASTMYVDPAEARWFGYYMLIGQNIKNAWIDAARMYQRKYATGVVDVAWAAYGSHENDTLARHSDPPPYNPEVGTYGYIYRTQRVYP